MFLIVIAISAYLHDCGAKVSIRSSVKALFYFSLCCDETYEMMSSETLKYVCSTVDMSHQMSPTFVVFVFIVFVNAALLGSIVVINLL